jgi:hypothetical protein
MLAQQPLGPLLFATRRGRSIAWQRDRRCSESNCYASVNPSAWEIHRSPEWLQNIFRKVRAKLTSCAIFSGGRVTGAWLLMGGLVSLPSLRGTYRIPAEPAECEK